ncbi:MAG: 50S ribosomal protein L29 [Proteobacteria bacterium]|nr:50S ribosomal protein L29 [Pseudomonadota bacterium]MBU1710059.1 50S ribosomal protein L29 [Pseudomonadota bacterium]
MKMKEIRELTEDALAVKLADVSEELFKLKFQHSIRPLENPANLRELRKNIARIKTVMIEKRADEN